MNLGKYLWLLAFFPLCAHAESTSMMPESFSFGIGGLFQGGHFIELKDGVVVDHETLKGKRIDHTLHIPPERWDAFKKKVNMLGVWQWKPSYMNMDITDGTQWNLELRYTDQSVDIMGSNAAPASINELILAVTQLTGVALPPFPQENAKE